MRHQGTLISSILLITILFITCTEEPAGPDISDDLKPKGTIVGRVFDLWVSLIFTGAPILQKPLPSHMCPAIISDCAVKICRKKV